MYAYRALVQTRHWFQQMKGPEIPNFRITDDLKSVWMKDAVQTFIEFVKFPATWKNTIHMSTTLNIYKKWKSNLILLGVRTSYKTPSFKTRSSLGSRVALFWV